MKKLRFYLRKNPELFIGLIITGFMFALIVFGSIFMPYDPDAMDNASKFASPSAAHILGCDNFGRDVFSRLIVGARTTLLVASGTVAIGTVIGIIVGALTGYYGGIVDEVLMRFNDAVLAFPSILLALVFISILDGTGTGTAKVVLSLGIVFAPSFARIIRGEFMKSRNLDYVRSARLMGASDIRIMFVHILPNTLPVLFSSIVIGFNNAVLAEAGMSYLGLGVQPPQSSLGQMLSNAQVFLLSAPLGAIIPGVTLALMVLGFSFLSDGIEKLG